MGFCSEVQEIGWEWRLADIDPVVSASCNHNGCPGKYRVQNHGLRVRADCSTERRSCTEVVYLTKVWRSEG